MLLSINLSAMGITLVTRAIRAAKLISTKSERNKNYFRNLEKIGNSLGVNLFSQLLNGNEQVLNIFDNMRQ